jgi:hypothetical protein
MQKSSFLRCAWRLSEARHEDRDHASHVIKTSQVMMRLFGGCLKPSEVILGEDRNQAETQSFRFEAAFGLARQFAA